MGEDNQYVLGRRSVLRAIGAGALIGGTFTADVRAQDPHYDARLTGLLPDDSAWGGCKYVELGEKIDERSISTTDQLNADSTGGVDCETVSYDVHRADCYSYTIPVCSAQKTIEIYTTDVIDETKFLLAAWRVNSVYGDGGSRTVCDGDYAIFNAVSNEAIRSRFACK